MSFSSWCTYPYPFLSPTDLSPNTDNHQYAPWNRTRNLQVPPYLARTDTGTARAAAAMANTGAVVIDFGGAAATPGTAAATDKKAPDSLFGPNIGVVSSGPAWTSANEKKVLADVLTPEVVRGWVEKSKEVSL